MRSIVTAPTVKGDLSGARRLAVNAWFPLPDLTEQAERLAAFRGVTFEGFIDE
jgi:hypothetical protein